MIDLNADLGEGGTNDAALIALVSSANIACGGHAGDETSMRVAIDACLAHRVALGAHPGYEDPQNFGRSPLDLPPERVGGMVARQLERFAGIAAVAGGLVHHVKPHGALYHQADDNPVLAEAIVRRAAEFFPGCHWYAPPGGMLAALAAEHGLRVCAEGFADRRYAANGKLVPRSKPGAVIEDVKLAALQALSIARDQCVTTNAGTVFPLGARTLCIHGDGPHALATLQAIREVLSRAGVALQAP